MYSDTLRNTAKPHVVDSNGALLSLGPQRPMLEADAGPQVPRADRRHQRSRLKRLCKGISDAVVQDVSKPPVVKATIVVPHAWTSKPVLG